MCELVQVREIVTVRNRFDPNVLEESPERRAYLVWRYVTEGIKAGRLAGTAHVYQGVEGYFWVGTVSSVLRELWPTISQWERQYRANFKTPIYEALKYSGNAIRLGPVQNREGIPWFIRKEWSEIIDFGALRTRKGSAVSEAREDSDRVSAVLAVMQEYSVTQPLTMPEVHFGYSQAAPSNVHVSTIRRIIGQLTRTGEVFHRVEDRDERDLRWGESGIRGARLGSYYSVTNPVPIRTMVSAIPGYVYKFRPPTKPVLLLPKKTDSALSRQEQLELLLKAIMGGTRSTNELAVLLKTSRHNTIALVEELISNDLVLDLRQEINELHEFVPNDGEEHQRWSISKLREASTKALAAAPAHSMTISEKSFLEWLAEGIAAGGEWVDTDYIREKALQSTRGGTIRLGKKLAEQGKIRISRHSTKGYFFALPKESVVASTVEASPVGVSTASSGQFGTMVGLLLDEYIAKQVEERLAERIEVVRGDGAEALREAQAKLDRQEKALNAAQQALRLMAAVDTPEIAE